MRKLFFISAVLFSLTAVSNARSESVPSLGYALNKKCAKQALSQRNAAFAACKGLKPAKVRNQCLAKASKAYTNAVKKCRS